MSDKSTSIISSTKIPPNFSDIRHGKNNALTNREKNIEKRQANDLSMLRNMKVSRHFEVYEATGNIIVTVKDEDTGKVIKEYPQREMLDLKARIDKMVGLLFDELV